VASKSRDGLEERTGNMEQDLRAALCECREQLDRLQRMLRQSRGENAR
jgi:hypothetical protein